MTKFAPHYEMTVCSNREAGSTRAKVVARYALVGFSSDKSRQEQSVEAAHELSGRSDAIENVTVRLMRPHEIKEVEAGVFDESTLSHGPVTTDNGLIALPTYKEIRLDHTDVS